MPSCKNCLFSLALLLCGYSVNAQVLTAEDSLTSGLVKSDHTTIISGYGQAKVQYDFRYKTAIANLTRNVLFIGHRFSNKISLFSEMEIENALVVGGETSGEISMEQLFLKFNLSRNAYLTAGLFLPRIGITNENHLPTTLLGNDRPYLETFVIPATWRELGVGLYGTVRSVPGLNYSLSLTNGLNSAGFENGSGIREGRFEGSDATASNIALSGALLYYYKDWRFQISAYGGGSAGLTKRQADSLQLASGPLGTPVILTEADVQYAKNGFSFRALGTIVRIPDAFAINRAYANNTPSTMLGWYAELGYDLLRLARSDANTDKSLTFFVRHEFMDLNYAIPSNGIKNGINKKDFTIVGLNYQPVGGIVVKADYVMRQTGDRNPELVVTPFPQSLPYYTNNGFFNLGIGYSF